MQTRWVALQFYYVRPVYQQEQLLLFKVRIVDSLAPLWAAIHRELYEVRSWRFDDRWSECKKEMHVWGLIRTILFKYWLVFFMLAFWILGLARDWRMSEAPAKFVHWELKMHKHCWVWYNIYLNQKQVVYWECSLQSFHTILHGWCPFKWFLAHKRVVENIFSIQKKEVGSSCLCLYSWASS